MGKVIMDALNMPELSGFYHNDSTIALSWIRGNTKKWKLFITNRVNEIRKLANPGNFRHVPTDQNVADMATRGVDMKKLLKSEEWWSGPAWLRQTHDRDWPMEPLIEGDIFEKVAHELLKKERKVTLLTKKSTPPMVIKMTKYSRMSSLLRIVAYCFRFAENCRSKVRNSEPRTDEPLKAKLSKVKPLTAAEIEKAEMGCIRLVQAECFQPEIKKLRDMEMGGHIEYKNVRVIIDDGILYVKNRLIFNPDMKGRLVLLPSDHHFTELLVWQCHIRLHHGGIRDIMAYLREEYWIVRMRQVVKKYIRACVFCKRWTAKHYNVEVAPLPPERISQSRCFSVVGIDFAGPVHVYDNDEGTKAYILIVSCATTRAIHLELVSNLSVYNFMLAFKRFVGRRGRPAVVISDNFSTFHKANQDLSEAWRSLKSKEFGEYVAENRIEWKFIVQCAPFWGGFYERMVRSVKSPLRKTLRGTKVNSEEMATILIEIEMVLNNRPLTYIYSSPDEVAPLTSFFGGE